MLTILAIATAWGIAPAPAAFGQATTNQDAKRTDAPAQRDAALAAATGGWWDDAVFYEIFVRSFADSTTGPLAGDGVGDLRGLIEKLDTLNDGDPSTTDDLGITGIWLMPIFESPSYHGYDTVDYYKIDSEYGTNADFEELMREAHKRGIRIILDLVINHSSRRHPWFLDSAANENGKRDWYIWSDERPTFVGPWNQNVWHAARGSYYYGIFSPSMPDLNFRNEEVTKAIFDITRFWLEKGADGYRLDAIRHLIEDGPVQENTPDTFNWLARFKDTYKAADPEALAIGEVWTSSEDSAPYVGEQMDMVFDFDLSYAMMDSAKTGRADRVSQTQQNVNRLYPPGQYGRFLTNHDQPRVMTTLSDAGAARVAAMMLLTGPGVPFIYYGEEIGMTGDKPDPEIRTPMPWTAEGGFTSGTPWKDFKTPPAELNLAAQQNDPDSLWSLYRDLIRLRNEHPALRSGAAAVVAAGKPGIYATVRGERSERRVLVAINLADKPAEDVSIDVSGQNVIAAGGPVWGGIPATLKDETITFTGPLPARSMVVIPLYQW